MNLDNDVTARLDRKAELALKTADLWKKQLMTNPVEPPTSRLLDLPPAQHGVEVSHDGSMLRVNVDGVCCLRVRVLPDKLFLEVTEATAKANRDATS